MVGLGVLFTAVSVFFGGLSPGFQLEAPVFLLRVGIAFTVLGVATVSLRSISISSAVIVSVATLAVVFVVGAAIMYSESSPTMTTVVAKQASMTLVLAPIPAGFVAGVLDKRGQPTTAYRTLIGTMVAAWILASLVLMAGGPVAPLGLAPIIIFTLAATLFAFVPRNLLRQVT